MDRGSGGGGDGSDGEKMQPAGGEPKVKTAPFKKRKRKKMKTAAQLEILEKTYAVQTYPSEALRAELSVQLGLTDRQLQLWFCHRRLKDSQAPPVKRAKKEMAGGVGDDMVASGEGAGGNEHGASGGLGSGSSPFEHIDRGVSRAGPTVGGIGSGGRIEATATEMPAMKRYCEPLQAVSELQAIAFVEAQLGERLREDGPILAIEFDPLPPSAFVAPRATMDNSVGLDFKVGQLAEMKTFEQGFRGAWFRCKIKDISWRKQEIKLEYYDFPDEEINWTKLYQVQEPPYGTKLKGTKKQLMVRPKYPPMYEKSEMPPVNSISEVSIIFGGPWKVGDLVDWHEKDCYWSGRVLEILDKDRVQIQLPPPPSGEGGNYEVFCKDLRPSLEWSPENGWTLLSLEGRISCHAYIIRLIFPAKQVAADAVSSLNASSSSHISATSLSVPVVSNTRKRTSEENPVNRNRPGHLSQSQQERMDIDVVDSANGKASSLDSIATSHVQVSEVDAKREELETILNSMLEDTLEAPIMDLEELANKIRWMKSLLQSSQSSANIRSSWKFVQERTSSTSQ